MAQLDMRTSPGSVARELRDAVVRSPAEEGFLEKMPRCKREYRDDGGTQCEGDPRLRGKPSCLHEDLDHRKVDDVDPV